MDYFVHVPPAKHLTIFAQRVGDKTPADLLIFASTDLKVDNSSLTGEAEPQERGPSHKGTPARPVEAENLAFNSTLVVNGEGWGIVVRTGDRTLIGQIAQLTGGETGNKSPLAVEIARFVLLLSTIAIIFAVVFLIVGVTTAYKGKATQTFTFAVSILVAFVPEGLPSTVTLLLSIAAKRMAAQNVLVKDLQGVETLGSLTLLATDKTGTLTRNQMTVQTQRLDVQAETHVHTSGVKLMEWRQNVLSIPIEQRRARNCKFFTRYSWNGRTCGYCCPQLTYQV
jgi:sodium/potassium-transporting ATPase subunit alpha